MADSFTDHGRFLKDNNRYHKIIDNYAKDGDADTFAQGLQKAGYATDSGYAENLISIMKRHELYKYNNAHKK